MGAGDAATAPYGQGVRWQPATERDEGCAFEELVSFHGGIGGLQTRPFIMHSQPLPPPANPSSALRPCTGG